MHSEWTAAITGFFALASISTALAATPASVRCAGLQGTAKSKCIRLSSRIPAPFSVVGTGNPLAAVTDRDHVRGNPDAQISIIEYGDFECPFCKSHVPTINTIRDTYKNDVNVVFRHFPLSFHPNAQKESEAAECAARIRGNAAFWKYHDALFARTSAGGRGFPLEKLVPLAVELGMPQAAFRKCLDSSEQAAYVQEQFLEGRNAGAMGTPTTFVVHRKTKEAKLIAGAVPFSVFKEAIDGMLKRNAGAK